MAPHRVAFYICLLLAVASCSSQNRADVTATGSTTPSTAGTQPNVANSAVAEETATTVGTDNSIVRPTVAEKDTATAPVQLRSASYGCGPADGPWVEADVVSSVGLTVVGEISLDGKTYGRSMPVLLQPGTLASIGFDPATLAEHFGRTATLRIVTSANPDTLLASADVVLRIPDGVGCG